MVECRWTRSARIKIAPLVNAIEPLEGKTVSVLNDLPGEQTEQLAVLYCDIHVAASTGSESLRERRRMDHLRAAQQIAEGFGAEPATTLFGGWASLFTSTVDALL